MHIGRLFLSRCYDELYAQADAVLKRHNPCQIRKEADGTFSCEDSRTHPAGSRGSQLCCGGCEHLGPQGCTVKSLACKVWTCQTLKDAKHPVVQELYQIKKAADRDYVPLGFRASKKQNFSKVRAFGLRIHDWGTLYL